MSEKNGQHEIIPMPASRGAVVQQSTTAGLFDPTADEYRVWANFDCTSDEGFALMSEMMHGEQERITRVLGEVIHLTHVIIRPQATPNPETGEITVYPLIWLRCADGRVYRCGSAGIFTTLASLIQWKGVRVFDPPVPVRVVEVAGSTAKRRVYKLIYTPQAAPPGKKGGGNAAK